MEHKRIRYTKYGEEIISKDDCKGQVSWDEGLEGYVCSECHWNTSIK